jgi:hypothetical protein
MPDAEDLSMLMNYLNEGGRVILSGAFIGSEEGERGIVLDVQVVQGGHPLAQGFAPDQVITLERFTADEDYATTVLGETDPQAVVFSRGPASELAGRPAVIVEDDASGGARAIWIAVPLYLWPTEERLQLANNAIDWILE